MRKFSKFDAEVVCELHPLFKGLLWVASARSSDETRAVLNGVHIEREGIDCHIVATDGRRMHIHTFEPGMFDEDIDMIKPGLYDIIAKTTKLIVIAPSECGQDYPDWRNIIPDYKPEHSDMVCSRSTAKIGVVTGVLLATDFVHEAIGFGTVWKKDEAAGIRYGSPDKTGAFVITHQFGKAIVMPMRLDPEEEAQDEAEPQSEAEATPDFPAFGEALVGLVGVLAADGDDKASMTISVGGKPAVKITTKQAKQIVKKAASMKRPVKKAARKK